MPMVLKGYSFIIENPSDGTSEYNVFVNNSIVASILLSQNYGSSLFYEIDMTSSSQVKSSMY